MKFRKSNINTKTICVYIYVFLMIALSNTVYFGLVHRSITMIVALIFIIVLLFCYQSVLRVSGRNIGIAVFFCSYLFFKLISVSEFTISSFRNNHFGYIFSIMVAFCASIFFERERIAITYVNLICILSVISIICFLIAIILPSIAYSLPSGMSPQGYYYSMFYTWGWKNYGWGLYLFKRNSGPFWEPGAFQGFLVLSILFCIHYGEVIKKVDKKLALLFITLLTTQSTTGLILFLFICIVWHKELRNYLFMKKTNRQIRIFLLLMVLVCIMCWMISTGAITNKLAQYSDNSLSTGIRLNDFIMGLKLCFVQPFTGLGIGTGLNAAYESMVGISSNSNGLITMIYSSGFLFGLPYIYFMIKGTLKNLNVKISFKAICIIFIMFILHMTEYVYIFPIYFMFLFSFQCDEKDTLCSFEEKLL